MLGKRDIAALERRAAAARVTMKELCAAANVAQSTWSRAKSRGNVRVSTLRKMEDALCQIEAAS